jgi:hypothetical protein
VRVDGGACGVGDLASRTDPPRETFQSTETATLGQSARQHR